MATYIVITKVPNPEEDSGNLALGCNLFVQEVPPSEENNYMGKHTPLVKQLPPGAVLALREPVFKLGEVLQLRGERDQWTRKPSKWGIETQEFNTAEEAFDKAYEVLNEHMEA